jgi:hypothetical protein
MIGVLFNLKVWFQVLRYLCVIATLVPSGFTSYKNIHKYVYTCLCHIGYSTIEKRGLHPSTHPKKKLVISNTGKFFCFSNNVSNLYNNSVVDKIYGVAYIFTLLMFRKPNKTTNNKNKTTNLYRQRPFDSRLYLDSSGSFEWKESFIFRYFKVFQVSQIFTCGLSDLLLLAVVSLVVFVLRE